jgi:hypothetical protein
MVPLGSSFELALPDGRPSGPDGPGPAVGQREVSFQGGRTSYEKLRMTA